MCITPIDVEEQNTNNQHQKQKKKFTEFKI
jgi:hypothetical protein